VGSVADVSEVHAAAIFRINMCKVGEFVCMDMYIWKTSQGRRVMIDGPSGPAGTLGQ
jgi:hypothetical protein